MSKKANDQITVLSLFSGCGGMDLGFEGGFEVKEECVNNKIHPEWNIPSKTKGWIKLPRTKFKTIFANDIFSAAKSAWVPYFKKRGNKDEDFRLASIVDLVKEYKSGNTKIFPRADVVTGGFPCQDFSVAGKRKGFNSHKAHHGKLLNDNDNLTEENRGKLYIWMRHVIDIVKPKVFVAENVKGLVSLADVKTIIENDFRNIGSGYLVVEAQVLYAPHYGIPQTRERVIFIGFRIDALKMKVLEDLRTNTSESEFNPYPQKTHGNGSQKSILLPYVNVGTILRDLPEPVDSDDPSHQSYSKAKWYGDHCQGQSEIDLGGLGPTIRAEHHGNIEFRRLSIAHGGKYADEIKKGYKERRLSVRECARIQTFPDDFEFVRSPSKMDAEYKISSSEGYKLVGNAVPPLLAYHVAYRLQMIWSEIFK